MPLATGFPFQFLHAGLEEATAATEFQDGLLLALDEGAGLGKFEGLTVSLTGLSVSLRRLAVSATAGLGHVRIVPDQSGCGAELSPGLSRGALVPGWEGDDSRRVVGMTDEGHG